MVLSGYCFPNMTNLRSVQRKDIGQQEIWDIVFINDLEMVNSLLIPFVRSYKSGSV